MPSFEEVILEPNQEESKIEINIENDTLIDYFEKEKEIEYKKNEELKLLEEEKNKELEIFNLELEEREQKIYEDDIKFKEDLLLELKEIKELTYQMSVKEDAFNLKMYNEQINFHNDFYIFLGLFVTAFVVLIFSKGWFGNAL